MHKDVTTKQIRGFVAVADEKSFTRAASKLRVSQSALTIAIQSLEAAVNAQLFDRTTRSVELTAQGRRFLPVALRLLDELTRGIDDLHAFASSQRGSVVVGSNASFIDVALAPAIAALSKRYPGISVRVIEDTADSLVKRVLTGEVDFGIATMLGAVNDIDARLLLKDRMGVLCRRDHPVALMKRDPAWPELHRYPMASLPFGAGIVAMLDDSHFASIIPKPMYEVSSVSSLFALVESGAGIAILPGIAAYSSKGRDFCFRPIRKPTLHRGLFFLRRQSRRLSPAGESLRDFMFRQLQEIKEGAILSLAPDLRRPL
jgi:DNA-binding transcriptional LysR family regulator